MFWAEDQENHRAGEAEELAASEYKSPEIGLKKGK